jgi:hypothetical protein
MKTYTYRELVELKTSELQVMQRTLADYLNTSDEEQARQLNQMITNIRVERYAYYPDETARRLAAEKPS